MPSEVGVNDDPKLIASCLTLGSAGLVISDFREALAPGSALRLTWRGEYGAKHGDLSLDAAYA